MLRISVFVLSLCFCLSAIAENSVKQFVTIAPGRELYIDYIPAKAGQPTLVLLNGLTYETPSWDVIMPYLQNKGYGILRYDPMGQGQTLRKYAPSDIIRIEDQATDLNLLLKALKLKTKVSLAGLSYGGGLAVMYAAMFPKTVDKVILMAPFVAPIPKQDKWIKAQIFTTRMMFPFNPATDDQLYDYFLKQIIYTTSVMAEPAAFKNLTPMEVMLKLEAVFRMTQGIRKMKAENYMEFVPDKSTHLIVALQDQYIPFEILKNFWAETPENKKVSELLVLGSEHKIPEAVPKFMAAWINEIMKENPKLAQKKPFYGNPFSGIAKCGDIIIKLTK